MKTIYLNIQSKGGAGKSMLTYLQALRHENNESVAFVDLDSSTQTSIKQLKFIAAKSTSRLIQIDIFDNLKKIEREKLFQIFEALNSTGFKEIFVDFGAPESEQLPGLFSIDFSIDEFKEFEKELNVKFVFNIIMAGGTAYSSSFQYLRRITELVAGKFEVNAFINQFTFSNYPSLIDEIKAWVKSTKGFVKDVKQYGAINIDRSSGQLITDNIKEGKGFSDYTSFASRTIIKRELAKL
jgi:hypothetical protein